MQTELEMSRNTTPMSAGSTTTLDADSEITIQVPQVQNAWEYSVYDYSSDQATGFPDQRSIPLRRTQRKVQWTARQSFDDSSEDELSSAALVVPGGLRARRHTQKFQDYDRESETSESSQSSGVTYLRKSKKLASRRSHRSEHNGRPSYVEVWDLSDSEDAGTSVPGKRKRNQLTSRDMVRRSARRKGSVDMREFEDDEIDEVDRKQPGPPKAIGAKEYFVKLPGNDPFRRCHSQTCHTCQESGDNEGKGLLIFCQGCTFAYHKKCLGYRNGRDHLVTKVGFEDFVLQCRRCIEVAVLKHPQASRQGHCQSCRQPGAMSRPLRDRRSNREEQKAREENDGEDPTTEVPQGLLNRKLNVLFRCIWCCRAFHVHHLPIKASLNDLPAPDGSEEYDDALSEAFDIRLAEYRRNWTCEDCSSTSVEIDGIVAWRPADTQLHYVSDLRFTDFNEDAKEYLIKWRTLSYSECRWMPGSWAWGTMSPIMRKTFEKRDEPARFSFEDAVPDEYLRIDIILDVHYTSVVKTRLESVDRARLKEVEKVLVKFKGLGYEDTAWEKPPLEHESERWSDYNAAYEEWVLGRHTHLPKSTALKSHLERIRAQDFEAVELTRQPNNLTGGTLMQYQLEGLNWLYYKWFSGQNAILADEMGLGKTIQVIGLLATLQQRHGCWPFLVVVPNSTCPNWRREVKQWAPSLRIVTYFGSSDARRLASKHEMFPDGGRDLHCHVVVTSYDAAEDTSFRTVFRGVPWAGLIVDEGQRLKSDKNILYSVLGSLKIPFKVLMTGTPLQNNQRELFNLLQFLDKDIDAAALEEEYQDLDREAIIEIHRLLRPFFLRRTKAQVLKHLPPIAQIIIPVSMTLVQRKLYKSILAKNQDLLRAIIGGGQKLKQTEKSNLNNILMQLRKCLCHPFIYNQEIEEKTDNAILSHRNLVEASAKLRLLEVMLPKLQERGHRVLVFSQFLDMLNIVEDFLDGLGMFYQRLDGSMNSLQKQKRIDEFNAPGSNLFAFLLSTRAGGVGINLATADTVIILDPDFNPHQDIQALSRAHRIGQEKKVLVFQLTTRDSVEEKIMQVGKKKMSLDHVLIDQMDDREDENVDLETILRHGAEALFDDAATDIVYDSTSVDKLLDRSAKENTEAGNDASADSQFSFARVWANDKANMDGNLGDESNGSKPVDPSLWDRILKEREQEVAQEAAARVEALGRGKRRRTNVDYAREALDDGHDLELSPAKPRKGRGSKDNSGSDTDFQVHQDGDGVVSDETASDAGEIQDAELELKPKAQSSRSKLIESPSFTRGFRRIELPSHSKSPRTTISYSQNFSVFDNTPVNQQGMMAPFPSQAMLPSHVSNSQHMGGPEAPTTVCVACNSRHVVGYCPLKLAGVEHCGLCGLAHYGHARTCPHLTSVTQCRQMLASLRRSQEPPHLVDLARKYIVGVIGDLGRRKKEAKARKERMEMEKLNGGSTSGPAPNGVAMDARVVDHPGPDGATRTVYADGKGNLFLPRPHPSANDQINNTAVTNGTAIEAHNGSLQVNGSRLDGHTDGLGSPPSMNEGGNLVNGLTNGPHQLIPPS